MHSSDFNRFGEDRSIEGKTRAEWEAELGIVGLVEHLKGLGWQSYQWEHRTPKQVADLSAAFERRNGKPAPWPIGCFAEFFSPYFHGYLRGDGETVRAATLKCLDVAQRFVACEAKHGKHEYAPFRLKKGGEEYVNGLVMCGRCGFNGHTSLVEALRRENEHLRMSLSVEKEMCARRVRCVEEGGETFEAALARELDELAARTATGNGKDGPR